MIAELLSDFAAWLPFGYAFGAGMLATVNPCGFLMLPSYVAYYLGAGEGDRRGSSLPARGVLGLGLGLSVTLGFVVLFSLIGLVVSLGGWALLRLTPAFGLAIGAALVGLGLWLLLGGQPLGLAAASRVQVAFKRNPGHAFLFGIAYGVASLSCALPIFLVVVGSALGTPGIARALLQFVSYSLGMGFVLVVVIVSTAYFQGALNRYLRRVTPYLQPIGALFLMGAGVYLIFYWIKWGGFF